MEPDDGVEMMDTVAILARVLDGADGQVDRRKVSDNVVLGLLAEVESLRMRPDGPELRALLTLAVERTQGAMSREYGAAQGDGCDPNGAWDCACEVKASEIVDAIMGASDGPA